MGVVSGMAFEEVSRLEAKVERLKGDCAALGEHNDELTEKLTRLLRITEGMREYLNNLVGRDFAGYVIEEWAERADGIV